MLPGEPSATSAMVALSAIGPAVPPGVFTLTAVGLVAEAVTEASSRVTVSVVLAALLAKLGLALVKLAVTEWAPAAFRICCGRVATPAASMATGEPTAAPSSANCTLPMRVWPPSETGLRVALKVLTSLYCTLGALTLLVVVAGLTVRLPVALLLAWV